MTTHQFIAVILLGLWLLSFAWTAWSALNAAAPHERRWATVAAITAIAMVVLRLAFVSPTFLHSNFHGYGLLHAIAVSPRSDHRPEYGPVSFLVLGAVYRLGKDGFTSVTTANQVFSSLALVFIGWVAARWTGRPRVAVLSIAVGALHPVLARVGASEDAHNLAAVFAAASLVAIDRYAVERDPRALVAAMCSLILTIETRQTFIFWPPCLLALALVRGSRVLLKRPEFIAVSVIVLAATGARFVQMALHPTDQVTLILLPLMLATPRILFAVLRHHPLLDIVRMAALTLPLGIVGLAWLVRRTSVGWVFSVLLALSFVSSLGTGFPTPGVEFSFRMPTVLLGILLAGVGTEAILTRLMPGDGESRRTAAASALAVAALALSPLLMPGARALRETSPQTEEYRFVQSTAATLGSRATFAVIEAREPAPSYFFPKTALADAGVDVRYVPVERLSERDFADGPVYFLQGLQCRGYSIIELGQLSIDSPSAMDRFMKMIGDVMAGQIPAGIHVSNELRPECAALLARAKPDARAQTTLPRAPSDMPFVMYGDQPIDVRLVELLSAPQTP